MRLEIGGFVQQRAEERGADRLLCANLGTGRCHPVDFPLVLEAPGAPILVAAIDGVGWPDGRRASILLGELLIEELAGTPPGDGLPGWRRRLIAALEHANLRLFEARSTPVEGFVAEITLAIVDRQLLVATVGATGGFLHRRGALTRVSTYDGGGEVLLESGTLGVEFARFTRRDCLGLYRRGPMEGDLQAIDLRRRDILLLCTSGAVLPWVPHAPHGPPELVPPALDPTRAPLPDIARQVVNYMAGGCETDASCLAVRFSGDDLPETDPNEPPLPWRHSSEGLPLYGGLAELEGCWREFTP